jgi:hypothetical protein
MPPPVQKNHQQQVPNQARLLGISPFATCDATYQNHQNRYPNQKCACCNIACQFSATLSKNLKIINKHKFSNRARACWGHAPLATHAMPIPVQ